MCDWKRTIYIQILSSLSVENNLTNDNFEISNCKRKKDRVDKAKEEALS